MNTHTHINLNDEQNFLRRYNLSGTECIPNSQAWLTWEWDMPWLRKMKWANQQNHIVD